MTWDNLRLWLYWLFENAGAEAKTSYTSVISGHWSDTERETANISATVWTSQAYGISRYRDTSPVEPNTEKLHSMTIKAGTEFHYRRNHNWQVDGGGTSAWSEMAHPSGASFNLSWVLLPCNHLTAGQLWIRKSEARKPQRNTQMTKWYKMNLMISYFFLTFWDFCQTKSTWVKHESNHISISDLTFRQKAASCKDSELRHAKGSKGSIQHWTRQRVSALSAFKRQAEARGTVGRVTWHVGEYLASERH